MYKCFRLSVGIYQSVGAVSLIALGGGVPSSGVIALHCVRPCATKVCDCKQPQSFSSRDTVPDEVTRDRDYLLIHRLDGQEGYVLLDGSYAAWTRLRAR